MPERTFLRKLRSLIAKRFWFFGAVIFLLISFWSLGFVKDLFFWREDFANMSFFYTGGNRTWPYQGIKHLIYPFYLLFGFQPAGYFICGLVLYGLLCLTLAFFVWTLTKNKTAAFLAGLIFASGYVGLEVMLMVETVIPSSFYLILTLLILVFYGRYVQEGGFRYGGLSFGLYATLVVLMSHRAHTLFPIIFLADLYFSKIDRKFNFRRMVGRLCPFFVLALVVYLSFPLFLQGGGMGGSLSLLAFNPQKFNRVANLSLLSDLGNYLIPSALQEPLVNYLTKSQLPFLEGRMDLLIGSLGGIILATIILGFLFFARQKRKLKLLVIFLISSWFISYLPFHLREYPWIHSSWSRYLFFGYPFFVGFISLVIARVFWESGRQGLRVTGVILVLAVIFGNLWAGRSTTLRKQLVERGTLMQDFISSLKGAAPKLEGKNLFYFDVVADAPTQTLFNSFLANAIFSSENALAFLYQDREEKVKIARDYNDFVTEYKKGIYDHVYPFYYGLDRKLISLAPDFFSNKANLSLRNPSGGRGFNNILEINTDSFPSYRPIQVDVKMRISPRFSEIKVFQGAMERPLLNYIQEREKFKELVQVRSNGDEYPYESKNAVDGNLSTSWIANKKIWRATYTAWIEIIFPHQYSFSEVRWISSYKNNLPLSYEYQVADGASELWRTVFSVQNRKAEANEYVVDRIPATVTERLRMVVFKSSGDFPAVSELEVLKTAADVSSKQADILMGHPFGRINSPAEAREIFSAVKDYLTFTLYPISDKLTNQNKSPGVTSRVILDGREHQYSLILPAGGTTLKSLLIKLPDMPLAAEISTITLKSVSF